MPANNMLSKPARAAALVLACILAAALFTTPAAAQTLQAGSSAKTVTAAASSKTVTFKSAKLTESAKYLNNPYRGWYAITAYTPTEKSTGNYVAARLKRDLKADEYKNDLVLVEFNLKNYNGRNGNPSVIGKKGLAQIENVLKSWSKAGKHLIVRLVYDPLTTTVDNISLTGNAKSAEPTKLATLEKHITQVAPTINKYKKCVYMVQGTSMGSWGEMHTSRFLPDIDGTRKTTYANIKHVITHMGKQIDKSIFLAVRRPSYYRNTVTTTKLTNKTGFKGTLASRVSLFNDGMFGSESDSGTYDSSRKSEVGFQSTLCRYVPNGGEAITLGTDDNDEAIVTDWNRFSTTATGERAKYGKSLIADMRSMHVSYLNSQWHTTVLANWAEAKYTGKGVFSGMNGKNYIERHLGYRYVLRSAAAKTTGANKAKVTLSIANVGFSPAYRPMTSKLSLVNKQGKAIKTYKIKSDNRLWSAGDTKELAKTINLKNIPRGTYTLRYSLTDNASGKQIKFANTAKQTKTGYTLGTLRVK